MSLVAEKLRAMQANLPPKSGSRIVRCPDDVPFIRSPDEWTQAGHHLYVNRTRNLALVWTAAVPETGVLSFGDEAQAVIKQLENR